MSRARIIHNLTSLHYTCKWVRQLVYIGVTRHYTTVDGITLVPGTRIDRCSTRLIILQVELFVIQV